MMADEGTEPTRFERVRGSSPDWNEPYDADQSDEMVDDSRRRTGPRTIAINEVSETLCHELRYPAIDVLHPNAQRRLGNEMTSGKRHPRAPTTCRSCVGFPRMYRIAILVWLPYTLVIGAVLTESRHQPSNKRIYVRDNFRAMDRRLFVKDPPDEGNAMDCGSILAQFSLLEIGNVPLPCRVSNFLGSGGGYADSGSDTIGDGGGGYDAGMPPPMGYGISSEYSGGVGINNPEDITADSTSVPIEFPNDDVNVSISPNGTYVGTTDDAFLPEGTVTSPDSGLTTEVGGANTGDFSYDHPPGNRVSTRFLLALRPTRPARAFAVAQVLTQFLDRTLGDPWNVLITTTRPSSLPPSSENSTTTRHAVYDLVLARTDADLVQSAGLAWWWSYRLRYACFDGKTGVAVDERAVIRNATRLINDTLERIIHSNDIVMLLRASPDNIEVLAASTDDSPPADRSSQSSLPPAPAPDTGIPNDDSNPIESLEPVDAHEWDTRRWFGLALFCTTIGTFVLLTQLAAWCHRKRIVKQTWGQLGTVEGVDNLLATGWQIKGSHMEIYDKTGVGYRDDDSLFLGGYEQKETVIDAEITVTHPESTTVRTPDTGNRS